MKFRIVKPGTNEDVMGGTLGLNNVYISAYAEIDVPNKMPRDLEIGEHTVATYRLSGTKGTYWIVRVE